MKRRFFTIVCTLLTVITLTACGASSTPTDHATMDTMVEMVTQESTTSAGATGVNKEYGNGVKYETPEPEALTADSTERVQKLIRTAWLTLETTSFDESTQGLSALTAEYKGYFENSSIGNRGNHYRWADYTIRIPSKHYEEFINQAGALCHETWRETSQEDISEAYYDTEGRLKTQQIKLERLQELLSKAENMEDIITIETAISDTEQAIDNLSGTLRNYDGKVDYATVHITLNEVYKLSNVEQLPDSFTKRLTNAFSNGWTAFTDTIGDLTVSLVYNWIWLLVWVIVIIVVVRVLRKHRPKFLNHSPKKQNTQDDKPE